MKKHPYLNSDLPAAKRVKDLLSRMTLEEKAAQMYLFHSGRIEVEAIIAPTLDFVPGRGLRFAVSFDEQPPQIVDALAHN